MDFSISEDTQHLKYESIIEEKKDLLQGSHRGPRA